MKSILFSFALLLSITVIAQDAGIKFVKEDLKVALDEAGADDKIIFVDAYTDWCGPCKMMDRNTFKDESVAKFYNANFINLKLDMEKGEGPTFALKHEVRGYPSLLFLNAGGQLVHRSIGYQDASNFLELGKAAMDPNKQVVTLQNRFKAGDRDQEFLANYADALTMAGMDGYEEATKAYLDQEKDWNTEKNTKFLFDYSEASMDSEFFQYMMKNRSIFDKVIGEQRVNDKIAFAASSDVRNKKIDATDKMALIKHFENYYGKKAQSKATGYYVQNLMYAPGEVNEQKYLSEVQLYMATSPELTSQGLNSHAWRIYELSDDKDLLSKANQWIEKSVQLEQSSFNTDTQAAILYKLGRKTEAMKAAELSIKLAEEEGNDSKATQELLEKIKMM